MKKSIGTIILFLIFGMGANGQGAYAHFADTLVVLQKALKNTQDDKARVLIYNEMASAYSFVNKHDSVITYGLMALALARKIEYPEGELRALGNLAVDLRHNGHDVKALTVVLVGLKTAERNKNGHYRAEFLGELGILYRSSGNYSKAIGLFEQSRKLYDFLREPEFSAYQLNNIGEAYFMNNQLDSALSCSTRAFEVANRLNSWVIVYSSFTLGSIYLDKHDYPLALSYFRRSLAMAAFYSHFFNSNLAIAKTYRYLGQLDSCVFYANQSLVIARKSRSYANLAEANIFLASIHETSDPRTALRFTQTALSYKDSLDKSNGNLVMDSFAEFNEQERQQELKTAQENYKSSVRQFELLSGVAALILIAAILFRNNRQKQKANNTLEHTLANLKSTQSQLIQSEKMASLGELTAGVAHEIQNPMNFVNNFSEVNTELIDELKQAIDKGDLEGAKAIVKDIKENEQKINLHGKRADAIVKGMLQHSRTSSGVKEPTDINALADEYLRLAYHGLRAKDKTFTAAMKTEFDATIGNVKVVPQDIGRVILNLITNAFYAVAEKYKSQPHNYQPTVTVGTAKKGNKVLISVKDNGNGIHQNVLDKIFQPFFTTKPTGQGTGLGLSLSYDIVKAHGGELKVETKVGEGAEFVIVLLDS